MFDTFEKKIYNIMCDLGFTKKSFLTYRQIKPYDDEYSNVIKSIMIAPKELGYAIDGVARYEAKLSEAKVLEAQKEELTFVGWTVCANTTIEYYKNKENHLYQYLYTWEKSKKGVEKRMSAIIIAKTKEEPIS